MITYAKQIAVREEINLKYEKQEQRDYALKVFDIGLEWAAYSRPYGSYNSKKSKRALYKETLSYLKQKSGYQFSILSPVLSMILWAIIKYIAKRILEQIFEEKLDFLGG